MDSIVTALEIRKDGLSLYPGNVSDYLEHESRIDSDSNTSVKENEKPRTAGISTDTETEASSSGTLVLSSAPFVNGTIPSRNTSQTSNSASRN